MVWAFQLEGDRREVVIVWNAVKSAREFARIWIRNEYSGAGNACWRYRRTESRKAGKFKLNSGILKQEIGDRDSSDRYY